MSNIFLFNVLVVDSSRRTEMQMHVFEPSCHKNICEQPKAEGSPKKPMKAKVYSYDKMGR